LNIGLRTTCRDSEATAACSSIIFGNFKVESLCCNRNNFLRVNREILIGGYYLEQTRDLLLRRHEERSSVYIYIWICLCGLQICQNTPQLKMDRFSRVAGG